jgi:cyclic pyranopterin phosphate synthase
MLSHLDKNGNAKMVDISDKAITKRTAKAVGFIQMREETLNLVRSGHHKKGDVLTVAKIAGIQAAKQTSYLIPMCHPIELTNITIDFITNQKKNIIECHGIAICSGKTGVEMEALIGVSTALLTIYDMCKAVDREMIIFDIQLHEKHGGKTGSWVKSS